MGIRYKKNEKRKWLRPVSLFFIIIIVLFAVSLLPKVGKKENPVNVFTLEKKSTQYYLPVTKYFSQRNNVSLDELRRLSQEKRLYVEKGQEATLSDYFGLANLKPVEPSQLTNVLEEGDVALIRAEVATPALKSLTFEGKYLWDKNDFGSYELKIKSLAKEEFNPQKITKLTALGDVMLSRHVNTQIKKFGFSYPWVNTKSRTANADITFANLEVPISNLVPAPATGMSFIAPTENLTQINGAGIDLVSVANNHTANFGRAVFGDNLKNLKSAKLGVCGGGLTESDSRSPVIVEKNGIKFAFLCYNSITGGLASSEHDSGVATLKIEPWYPDSDLDINKMVADIKAAKKLADVVIVSPHWGVEYKVNPNRSQKKVAKAAVEAGAEMIIGTHPHVVQGAEMVAGKYVNYSLGNFIFDQEWSQETTEGVVLECYFYKDKLVATSLAPIKIKNYSQPSFVAGLNILARIAKASLGF